MVNLTQYLSPEIRSRIEQDYYARVNTQSHFDRLVSDPSFLVDPNKHVGFFSDHGVVHVRDVAQQIVQVVNVINGVLIPKRSLSRLEFLKSYGVMVAYLHDIGMADFTQFGRAMHPEFAAQAVFRAEFDDIIQNIWNENCGNVAWRLLNLSNEGLLTQNPKLVLRELLSLCVCHSKSKIPVDILNAPSLLRQRIQASIKTDLHILYHEQRVEKAKKKVAESQPETDDLNRKRQALEEAEAQLEQIRATRTDNTLTDTLQLYYDDFSDESFAWLLSEVDLVGHLVNDVIDTLRALRCADALRQRGTVFNTSGGYQIFVDRQSANAIHAFKKGQDEMLLLLETEDIYAAGEANMASSELTIDGDLRIAFHRGAFANDQTIQYAAQCAAFIVNDIQSDVIDSFHRPDIPDQAEQGYKKGADEMLILLEGVDDNPDFTRLVATELAKISPHLHDRTRLVSSLQNMSDHERNLYLNGQELNWDADEKQRTLAKIAQSGHKTTDMDPIEAFAGVKLIHLAADEVLIEAGSPPGFVYIALADGLKGTPLGGYRPFPVYPWTPLGNTGVIRGAARNASVVAEKPVSVLMIPKEVYLRQWHHTYTPAELNQLVTEIYGDTESNST